MFVYADNAATTKIDPEVLKVMLPFLKENFGNPSTFYSKGREVSLAIEHAREQVAQAIGAKPSEIYFTSCGTESDNWAIRGIASRYTEKRGKHIITTNIEHHAVLHTLKAMEKEGYEVTYLPVDREGFISPHQVEDAIRPDTLLITVMTANNEIGSVQPIVEIGKIARAHKVLFHTDAVQAVGHIPVNVEEMQVDLLSLSAHKFCAPKGIGALYIRKGVLPNNLLQGGGQERGKRPGTENTAAIVGMGAAIEKAVRTMEQNTAKISVLRDRLIAGIMNNIPYCIRNTPTHDMLPGTVNISVRYIEGESLLLLLDMNGICASSGSACASGSLDPSHVLLALGLPHETAHGSVRFSLNHENTIEQVDYIIQTMQSITTRLRDMSPLWENVSKESSFQEKEPVVL